MLVSKKLAKVHAPQVVHIPSPKDMYSRIGERYPDAKSVDYQTNSVDEVAPITESFHENVNDQHAKVVKNVEDAVQTGFKQFNANRIKNGEKVDPDAKPY